MRDPNRIPRMLRKVYLIWRQSPDLRLLQLLSWVAEQDSRRIAARFIEDDDLEPLLDKALQDRSAIDALGDSLGFEDAVIRDG